MAFRFVWVPVQDDWKPRWTFNCVIYTFTKSKLFHFSGYMIAPSIGTWVLGTFTMHDKITLLGGPKESHLPIFLSALPPPPHQKPPCKTVELPGFRALSMSLSACQKKLETVGQTKTFLQTLIYQTKECNMSNSVLVQQIYPAIQYFPLSPSQTWSTVASSSGHPGTSLLDGVRRD